MAKCSCCGAETQLYVDEQPICTSCDDKREKKDQAKRDSSRDSEPTRSTE